MNPDPLDPLSAARGIANAFKIAVPIWILIAVLVCVAVRGGGG